VYTELSSASCRCRSVSLACVSAGPLSPDTSDSAAPEPVRTTSYRDCFATRSACAALSACCNCRSFSSETLFFSAVNSRPLWRA